MMRRWRSGLGRRYRLSQPLTAALSRVFGESVDRIVVMEHSLYARAHLGMRATTRPNRILLAGGGKEFIADHELVLHEYFHVVRQWGTGELTRSRYLCDWARRGYRDNRFEREAREFAASTLAEFDALISLYIT